MHFVFILHFYAVNRKTGRSNRCGLPLDSMLHSSKMFLCTFLYPGREEALFQFKDTSRQAKARKEGLEQDLGGMGSAKKERDLWIMLRVE